MSDPWKVKYVVGNDKTLAMLATTQLCCLAVLMEIRDQAQRRFEADCQAETIRVGDSYLMWGV